MKIEDIVKPFFCTNYSRPLFTGIMFDGKYGYATNHGIQDKKEEVFFNCIGRYVKGNGCDWSLGGLLQINKVSVLKDAQVFPVFEMADVNNEINVRQISSH